MKFLGKRSVSGEWAGAADMASRLAIRIQFIIIDFGRQEPSQLSSLATVLAKGYHLHQESERDAQLAPRAPPC